MRYLGRKLRTWCTISSILCLFSFFFGNFTCWNCYTSHASKADMVIFTLDCLKRALTIIKISRFSSYMLIPHTTRIRTPRETFNKKVNLSWILNGSSYLFKSSDVGLLWYDCIPRSAEYHLHERTDKSGFYADFLQFRQIRRSFPTCSSLSTRVMSCNMGRSNTYRLSALYYIVSHWQKDASS